MEGKIMSDRYLRIYTAAILNSGTDFFDPPLTADEKQQYKDHRKWIEEQTEKARKENRQIIFDIPFDP